MSEREAALARARSDANRRVLLAFVSLVCAPIGVFVLFASVRALARERALGLRSSSTPVAIALSALSTVLFVSAAGLSIGFVVREAQRPPELWIANGTDEVVAIDVDGVTSQTVEAGSWYIEEIEPGEHEICASGHETGVMLGCTTRSFANRESVLWNPGETARFFDLRAGPGDALTRTLLPRSEWLPLAEYDVVLTDWSYESQYFERRVLAWGRSSPVLIVIDNHTAEAVSLELDGDPPEPIDADHWLERHVREGRHHLRVTSGERVLFDETRELAEETAHLLDVSGACEYRFCREVVDGEVITMDDVILEPAVWRDVSDVSMVFEATTPADDWADEDLGSISWLEHPCPGPVD